MKKILEGIVVDDFIYLLSLFDMESDAIDKKFISAKIRLVVKKKVKITRLEESRSVTADGSFSHPEKAVEEDMVEIINSVFVVTNRQTLKGADLLRNFDYRARVMAASQKLNLLVPKVIMSSLFDGLDLKIKRISEGMN